MKPKYIWILLFLPLFVACSQVTKPAPPEQVVRQPKVIKVTPPATLLQPEQPRSDPPINTNESLINFGLTWKGRALKCYAHVDSIISWFQDDQADSQTTK